MKKDKGQKWLDKLDQSLAENSKLSLFLLAQFLVIGMLVIGYMKMIDKLEVNVELPKTIKESGVVNIGKKSANALFFRMWGREDIENISDFNYKNIKNKMKYLKERMYPPTYFKFSDQISKFQKEVRKDLISQKFTFDKENIHVKLFNNNKEAVVSVKGFYNKLIDDDTVFSANECVYKLGYLIEGGHIYVNSFKTTCK